MVETTERTAIEADTEVVHATPAFWRLVARKTSPIVVLNEAGSGPALYCVHPVAGDVTSYTELVASLGAEQRVYGIQVPKSRMNAAFAQSIEAMARHYAKTIMGFQPEGPVVLSGWSAGAVIALEIAQQLRVLGREVPLVVAFDGAPCNTGAGMSRWNPIYVWKVVWNIPGWFREEMKLSLSLRVFVRRFFSKINGRRVLPAARDGQTMDTAAVQRLLENTGWSSDQLTFISALYAAVRSYVPKPYAGRVVVYETKVQPLGHLRQVAAAWTRIAQQLEVVRLDGGHDLMLRQPQVDALTKHLRVRIAELREGSEEG